MYGALLGIALLALWRRGTPTGIGIGVAASIAVVLTLQAMNVAFFWWYPAACLVVIGCALAISPRRHLPVEQRREGDEEQARARAAARQQ